MEKQVLSKRYIDKADLNKLLKRLFGSNYSLEVGIPKMLPAFHLIRFLHNRRMIPATISFKSNGC